MLSKPDSGSTTPAERATSLDEDWISNREMTIVLILGFALWGGALAFVAYGLWLLVEWVT